MPNTYLIGKSTAKILLTARITAAGPAATRAIYLDLADPADTGTEVAVSSNATGNVIGKAIGDYTTLKGKRLSVNTLISITGTDLPTRQQAAGQCAGSYKLDQGDDGPKQFANPFINISDDAAQVTITFNIDLQ